MDPVGLQRALTTSGFSGGYKRMFFAVASQSGVWAGFREVFHLRQWHKGQLQDYLKKYGKK